MPAESEAQRRYLNMKFGHEWVKEHHFDNKGKLPPHVAGAARAMGGKHMMKKKEMMKGGK